MPVTPQGATVLAILIIATTLIVLMSRFSKGRAQAKEDDLRKAATLRGWAFAKANDRGYRVYTFSGTTEGIAWIAESAKLLSGNRNHQRRHIARWHGTEQGRLLRALAEKEWLISADNLEQQFFDTITSLVARQRERSLEHLLNKARQSELSAEEKNQLRELLSRNESPLVPSPTGA